MANSKAKFPKHIFVVRVTARTISAGALALAGKQESGNDEEWLAIYAELADIPESAGEVATYDLAPVAEVGRRTDAGLSDRSRV